MNHDIRGLFFGIMNRMSDYDVEQICIFRYMPRGSPKADHRGSLQNRPMVIITRDVDPDARANTLGCVG